MPRTKKTDTAEIKPKKAVKTVEKKVVAKTTKKSVVSTEKKAEVLKPTEATVPVIEKKTKSSLKTEKKEAGLNIDLYDITGKTVGKFTLPNEIFGAKINSVLVAQAVRVYLANQRQGTVSTKTRGEVRGSTRKIYRQKGTGRARHGAVRAPIFVHGGIAHGPKPQDYSLSFPQKMKQAALFSALSSKANDNTIRVISGLSAIETKTKTMAQLLQAMRNKEEKLLLVLPGKLENVYRAARNIKNVSVTASDRLTTYEVLDNKIIIFMQEAIDVLQKRNIKEKSK